MFIRRVINSMGRQTDRKTDNNMARLLGRVFWSQTVWAGGSLRSMGAGPMKQTQAHVAESGSLLRGCRKDSQLEPAFRFPEFPTEGREWGLEQGVWSLASLRYDPNS